MYDRKSNRQHACDAIPKAVILWQYVAPPYALLCHNFWIDISQQRQICVLIYECYCVLVLNSYRRLALEYHPDKSTDVDADETFSAIGEAYTVLSTPKLRAIYDAFGLEGLYNGAPVGDQGYSEGWSFHGDARLVFREFFGGGNPFQDIFPKKLNDEFNTLPVLEPRTRKEQDPPWDETVYWFNFDFIPVENNYIASHKLFGATAI